MLRRLKTCMGKINFKQSNLLAIICIFCILGPLGFFLCLLLPSPLDGAQ